MRTDLARNARIELAENLAALASDLGEAVMFIAERDRTDPRQHLTDDDEQELIRILKVAAKLKRLSTDIRNNTQ